VEKLSELKAIAKSRGAGQCIDRKLYSGVISMNDAITQSSYDTSPFRSALRPVLYEYQFNLDFSQNSFGLLHSIAAS
jgi:hypothetical protein